MLSEEETLKHVLETSQVGYWDWDLQENKEYISPRFKEILGYQPDELQSFLAIWSAIIHPEDIPGLRVAFQQHVASRGSVPFRAEARCYHRGGGIIWVQCQGKVTKWSVEGDPLRFVSSFIDITAQRQTESELRHYQAALTSLKRVATNAHLDYDEQIDAALEVVATYLKLPLGIVSHVQGSVYEVVNVFLEESPIQVEKGQWVALSHTYCGITYEKDAAFGVHHVGQSAWATHPYYVERGLESYIGAPVRVKGEPYGTVCFSGLAPRARAFSQYDLEFIEIFATWVGYSVEKREVDKSLKVSQKKMRALFENSRDAIMLVDHTSLKIIDCNQMAIDLYELDGKEELVGRRGVDFHKHLFNEDQHERYHALRYAGDFFSTDVEYKTKQGNRFWGNLSVFVFSLENRLFQWVRVVDVTEARSRERELRDVKEILSQQAKELQEANQRTRDINDSLEFMVWERTMALEERNRQLADFAFLNAHKMRGPLARILGLVDVLKYTDSREQEKEYLQHIVQSAQELDQVIRTAASTLVTPEYAEGDGSSETHSTVPPFLDSSTKKSVKRM